MNFDPLRLSLFLLMIVSVSRIHQHFKVIGKLRPALVLAAATGIYAFLNPRLIRIENMRLWMPRVVLALGVLACLSVPFGVSLGGSATFILEEYWKTLLFAVLLTIAVRSATDLYTLVWAYVVSCAILVWMSLVVFGLKSAAGSEMHRLSHLYTFDANDVGLVTLIGLALALLTFQTSGKWGKIASGIIVVGIGATLARTGSRGAFVGLVVVGIVLLFALTTVPAAKRLGFAIVTAVGLLIASPEGYWQQMSTLLAPTSDYNWQTREGRKQVALRGLGYMIERPFFGVGIDNFWRMECILGEKARTNRPGTGLRCTPPHNSYVQAGAELGVPGLLLWTALVFGGIRAMWRLRRRVPRSWAKGTEEERFLYLAPLYLMLAMVSFAVTSLFLTFAWLDSVYILAAFMTGLHVCIDQKLVRAAVPERTRVARPIAAVRAPSSGPPRGRRLPPPDGSGFIPSPS
jgi:O-antigen ligase